MAESSKSQRSRATAGARASPAPQAPDPIDAATLDEAFVKALEADFIAHGKGAIESMRGDKPTDYVKLVAALRDKEADDATDPLRELSDADLDRRIEEVARRVGFEIRAADGPAREGAATDQGEDAD